MVFYKGDSRASKSEKSQKMNVMLEGKRRRDGGDLGKRK
jgi:hypothetical protein